MSWKNLINKVNCTDAMDLLKQIPDKSIDLCVTSPPYDNLRDYRGYVFKFEKIADELLRVIKDGGVVVWVVGDQVINGSETGTSFKQALYFKEIGFNLHDTMIYEKNSCPFPDKTRYNQIFEYMFILSVGRPNTINLIKDRKNRWEKSFGKSSNRKKDGSLEIKKQIEVNEFGVRNNIFKYNTGFGYTTKDSYAFEHPAMFPEKLASDNIMSWSNKNDLVLDCFMGAWTTAKMAQNLKRNFIGCEIDKDYCEIGKQRLRQMTLF